MSREWHQRRDNECTVASGINIAHLDRFSISEGATFLDRLSIAARTCRDPDLMPVDLAGQYLLPLNERLVPTYLQRFTLPVADSKYTQTHCTQALLVIGNSSS